MSSLRTWASALAVTLASMAQASDRNELAEIIASCTGRLSAELEFAWLMSDPDVDRIEIQRTRFVDILESLGPPADPQRQLAVQIETKMAHARLLTTAYFGGDTAHAAWAKRHAVLQRKSCQNMLLES